MAQDFDVVIILDLISFIVESDPLGLLKSIFNNLVYYGEFIELGVQELFIAIRANKLLHVVVFYSLALWLIYLFLFPKRKSISITYVKKTLTIESQEALMRIFKSKNQDVKLMLENLKGSNDSKKPNEILKKIDQAINEIKNLQDLHNEFKGEIIDSHNQIIESLKPNRSNYYKEAEEPEKKLENEQEEWENIEKFEVKEDKKVCDDREKELISVEKNEEMAEDWVKIQDLDVKSKENDIETPSKAEKLEKTDKISPKPMPKIGKPLPKLPFPTPKIGNPPPKLSSPIPIPKTANPAPKLGNPKSKPENTDQKTEDLLSKPIEKPENSIPKPIEKLDNPFQKAFEKIDNPPKFGEKPDIPQQKAKEKFDTPLQNPFLKAKAEISQEKTENPLLVQPIEKSYLKQEKPEPKTKESEKNLANDEVKNQAEDSEEKHIENTPKPNVPPSPKIFIPRPSPISIGKAPPIRTKPPQSEPSERAQYVAPQAIKSNPFG